MQRIILLGFMLSVLTCSAQKKAITVSLKKMEKFNNQNFEDIKVNGEVNFTMANGNIVRQLEYKESYIEYIVEKETPFETVNEFDKSTGALKGTGEKFYGFPIGIFKEYDQNGVLIKETNFDEPFKFTIEDLAQKINHDFHINILVKSPYNMLHRTINPIPTYQFTYPVIEENSRWLNVLIYDGITGSLIKKDTTKSVE